MDCLINYIGLKDCSPAPASGLYINSLPGISTDIVEAVAMKEEETHTAVWSDVNEMAGRRFETDVLAQLRTKYELKVIRQLFEFIPEAGAAEAGTNEYRGIVLDFSYQLFTFQAFSIGTVYFHSTEAVASTTLKIVDRYNQTLYQKEVAVIVGLNAFTVDRIFPADRLFIGIDFGDFDSGVASDISPAVQSCYCQAVHAICNDCRPSFYGATLSTGGVVTATGNNSHGVGVVGAAACDYSTLVCNNKKIFISAWMYLLGNQLIIHLLHSDRINKYTTADREKFEALRDHYQVQYENQLAEAVKGLVVNTSHDCCIACNETPVKSVQWLP